MADDDEASMAKLLAEKAQELFKICDREEKGFICKRDMQRMLHELPLDPDQLEDVFDSLDIDGNGFLTLEEFTSGFGSFLGMPEQNSEPIGPTVPDHSRYNSSGQHKETIGRSRGDAKEDNDDDEEFLEFLVYSGAVDIVGDNDSEVRQLWSTLREEGLPQMQALSSLLRDSSEKIRRANIEQQSLESALRQQQDTLNSQMQNMSEEMEAQIAAEREKAHKSQGEQEQKVREELEAQLALKDLELRMTNTRFAETESKLAKLTTQDCHYKTEMAELQKQKDLLEEQFARQTAVVDDLKSSIDKKRSSVLDERKKRAMAAFSVTETIAQERQDLVKQLDLLKNINAKLLDDQDTQPPQSGHKKPANIDRHNMLDVPDSGIPLEESDCEVDDVYAQVLQNSTCKPPVPAVSMAVPKSPLRQKGSLPLQSGSSLMDELMMEPELSGEWSAGTSHQDTPTHAGVTRSQSARAYSPTDRNRRDTHSSEDGRHHSSTLLIYQSNGRSQSGQSEVNGRVNGLNDESQPRSESPASMSSSTIQPQRVFKVIIIGDAGVGKSCFVQRICTGEVDYAYATTIGVDFRVHTIVVDGKTVSIQLWDTAGQERYRSITKQYFRKADGVFVAFDVTSENSFKHCREWIQSVKEMSADETCVILLGNKLDLCPDPERRAIRPDMARQLADRCGAIYIECSATSDIGVHDAIRQMARMLFKKEDDSIENSIKLVAEVTPKKKCC